MQPSPTTSVPDRFRVQRRRLVWPALVLAGLFVLVSLLGGRAIGAGTLVVIEDVSQLGNGSFSGNVCYQVIRNSDGVTMSEGCFSIAATIAAPDDFNTNDQYTILVSLADRNCELLDDPRTGSGTSPFLVRVSCDDAFMTATAAAGGPFPAETPASDMAETPAVELTAWPPVYDLPTAAPLVPDETPVPVASPIPSFDPGSSDAPGRSAEHDGEPGHAELTPESSINLLVPR